MDEVLPVPLSFSPSKIMRVNNQHLVIGVDGELQWLGKNLGPLSDPVRPFPMKISHITCNQNMCIATWIDHELMIARMACFDLNLPFQEGPTRSEVRQALLNQLPIHPKGTIWSHALDAEPIALTSDDCGFYFALWKKGVYGLTYDREEMWRKESPTWPTVKKRPRNQEIIQMNAQDDELHLISKGGLMKIWQKDTGALLRELTEPLLEGPIESLFACEQSELLVNQTGEIAYSHRGHHIATIKMNGPVQDAVWDHRISAWRISGWREEFTISRNKHERHAWDEILVGIVPVKGGALVLFNDGTWKNSATEWWPDESE